MADEVGEGVSVSGEGALVRDGGGGRGRGRGLRREEEDVAVDCVNARVRLLREEMEKSPLALYHITHTTTNTTTNITHSPLAHITPHTVTD